MSNTTDLVVRIVRAEGLFDDYQHWSGLWIALPRFTNRLLNLMSIDMPSLRTEDPLYVECLRDGAEVIRRWRSEGNSLALVRDAARATLRRSLDASAWRVDVQGKSWVPDRDAPLGVRMQPPSPGQRLLTRRTVAAELIDARAALLRGLERHVYCSMCERSLRMTFSDLMAGD